jgi:hypothetical protein
MITPEEFGSASTHDLLSAAARGVIGVDHRLLRSILDRPESEWVTDLVRFGLEDHDQDAIDLEGLLIDFLRHRYSPLAKPYIEDLARKHHWDVPDEFQELLTRAGADVIDLLTGLYRAYGAQEGADLAFALAALGVMDARILNVLLEHLRDNPSDGAFALGIYADPAARPALEQALARSTDDALRGIVQRALADIEDAQQRPQPIADEAFDIWAKYPASALPEFDVLSEFDREGFLDSPIREYRAAAVDSFFNEELPQERAAKILRLAVADPEPLVRGQAWETLGSNASSEPALLDQIAERLLDSSVAIEERGGAAVAVARRAHLPFIREAILTLYEDPKSRAKALEAMWRSLDRGFAPYFQESFDAADPEVRRQAILGTGYLRLHTEASRLEALFEDEECRTDALLAYALSTPAEISPGRIPGFLRRIEQRAGGLTLDEADVVKNALDQRLVWSGYQPFFEAGSVSDEDVGGEEAVKPAPAKTGRNQPCPCGSGKKYKKCCGK